MVDVVQFTDMAQRLVKDASKVAKYRKRVRGISVNDGGGEPTASSGPLSPSPAFSGTAERDNGPVG